MRTYLKTILALFLIILHWDSIAQSKLSQTFGEISGVDFEYEPEDKEAPAVILFDIGDTEFASSEGWFEIRQTRTKRIKILSEEGLDYSNISIPYYSDGYGRTERIEDLECYTYNLTANGQLEKTKLNLLEVFNEKINDYWERKIFAMPQVKPGAIIDIKYIHYSPFFFNLPDWEFQSSIPTAYSKCIVRMIPFYEYVYLPQGIRTFDERSSKESTGLSRYWSTIEFRDFVHTLAMKDLPAFKDESFISSRNDYIMKLDFQLSKYYGPDGQKKEIMTTWPQLVESYSKHDSFGKYIKKASKQASNILEELDIQDLGESERAKYIIEYVKNYFSWTGFNGEHANEKPNELVKTKSGNTGSINLFMLAMLQESGIEAKPIILSTRDHGKVHTEYSFANFFNYVIVMVNTENETYFADGTDTYLSHNRIPTRCLNGLGLLMDEEHQWVDLYSDIDSWENMGIKIQVDAEKGLLQSDIINNLTEFDAYQFRKKFNNDTTRLANNLLDNGFSEISKVKTRNYTSPDKPYSIGYIGEQPLEIIDEKIVIKPLLDFPMSKNPLTQDERSYPVDFIYKHNKNYLSTIQIPEGYEINYLPQNFKIDNSILSFNFSANVKENSITVLTKIEFKKSIYSPNQYQLLKNSLDSVVKRLNESVVLQKKG